MLHAPMYQQLEKDKGMGANGTVRYRISPTRMESTMAKVGRIDASFNPDTMHVCSEHFEPNLLEPWGM